MPVFCALDKPQVISSVNAVIRCVSKTQEEMVKNEHDIKKYCKDNRDFSP